MNSLPKDIQILISEYNVEHRPTMRPVLVELKQRCKEKSEEYNHCCGCFDSPQFTKYILFKKYVFCSEWCYHDIDTAIRQSYRKRIREKLKSAKAI